MIQIYNPSKPYTKRNLALFNFLNQKMCFLGFICDNKESSPIMSKKQGDLLNRILESVFYKSSMNKAGKVSSNAQSILEVLKRTLTKTKDLGTGGIFDLIREKVTLLGRLLKSYADGSYRDISTKNLISIIAGFLYFISPIDLIPDFLPMVGFMDDIALLTFIVRGLGEELEKFELWEMNNPEN
ncbi:Uncharacterized membrane protein YkvA, DUF1232 family [Spirosomataceae bacterium TFI 002]|nr:Uncharacterized membrane protein YkvA, DUF1232 family [Spirosomataceae bacterium TFI 002]